MNTRKIILATTSPHRKAAFTTLGIPFETQQSDVDEYFEGRPSQPEELVLCLARLKAESVANKQDENCVVVGFDSVGWFENQILEKPKSKEDAFQRLRAISGKSYQFFTAVNVLECVEGGRTCMSRIAKTEIEMRDLTDSEISWYLDQDLSYGTYAQGYNSLETYGSTFVKSIRGSYNNAIRGMPLEIIMEMFKEIGFEIKDGKEGTSYTISN